MSRSLVRTHNPSVPRSNPSGPVWAILTVATLVPQGLILSGCYVAVFGHRFGAYLLLSGFALTLVIHLALGIVGYRDVMNRPWPQVPRLEEDDEW